MARTPDIRAHPSFAIALDHLKAAEAVAGRADPLFRDLCSTVVEVGFALVYAALGTVE